MRAGMRALSTRRAAWMSLLAALAQLDAGARTSPAPAAAGTAYTARGGVCAAGALGGLRGAACTCLHLSPEQSTPLSCPPPLPLLPGRLVFAPKDWPYEPVPDNELGAQAESARKQQVRRR